MRQKSLSPGLGLSLLIFVVVDGIGFTSGAQTLTVLHTFPGTINNTNQDGANPIAGPALLGTVLCGTTVNGGRFGAGTVFSQGADGAGFDAFRSFTNSPDAAFSQAELVVAGSSFYGATFGGGSSGTGAIFAGQTNGSVSRVANFAALNADNATNLSGASPSASLLLSGGRLYGTASAGGSFANGTVFSLATNGPALSVLHHFSALDSPTGTNTDGATPWGGLVLSGNTLYGTAAAGGSGGSGTVFAVDTNGGSFTTLYSFSGMDPVTGTNTDGAIPFGSLALFNGTLYGTATAGGEGGSGVVFSIATNGAGFTVLYHFSATDPVAATNADGARPFAALTLAGGVLYGSAAAGAYAGSGAIFSINTNGTQFNTLYSFTAVNPSNSTNSDGAFPIGGLLSVGNSLYGTAFGGGSGSAGTVFKLTLPVAPAVITGIIRDPDGSVTLSFLGSPNSTNVVQTTTNLTPSVVWWNVSTNVADTGGSWQFTDTDTGLSSVRFYRSYYAP